MIAHTIFLWSTVSISIRRLRSWLLFRIYQVNLNPQPLVSVARISGNEGGASGAVSFIIMQLMSSGWTTACSWCNIGGTLSASSRSGYVGATDKEVSNILCSLCDEDYIN